MQHSTLAALLGCFLMVGCGPVAKPTGKLQGAVTFDGTPVKDATIQLHSAKTGEGFSAKLDVGGKYTFESPVTTGEYRVAIIPAFVPPVAGAGGKTPPSEKPPERKDIPERYRTTTKSDLKVDVKTGDNTFDAKLTK